MKTQKERKLEIALLKEKLERISGKKVLFKEGSLIDFIDHYIEVEKNSEVKNKLLKIRRKLLHKIKLSPSETNYLKDKKILTEQAAEKKYNTLWYAVQEPGKDWNKAKQKTIHGKTWKEAVREMYKISKKENEGIRLSTSEGFDNQGYYFWFNGDERLLESQKRPFLKESKVDNKDWERMLSLILTGKDGTGVARTIKSKDKAIARFIAGIKLQNEKPYYKESIHMYHNSFSEFGEKALKLGATVEEIQKVFDETSIPAKYLQKLKLLGDKNKKLDNRFVGPISKLVLDKGFDINFLPHNGYAITIDGKEAMERNGRKWTIGYKAEIDLGNKKVTLIFDAITDEGDGPTFYVTDYSSDILQDRGPMGQRKFLTMLKEKLEEIK